MTIKLDQDAAPLRIWCDDTHAHVSADVYFGYFWDGIIVDVVFECNGEPFYRQAIPWSIVTTVTTLKKHRFKRDDMLTVTVEPRN